MSRKIAFVFSGQGAQYSGMGKEIANEYKCSMDVYNRANEAIGYDIKELIFNGSDEELKITEKTQPSILTVSVASMMPLLENGIKPEIVAGLSLGEYSAHVASGTFAFEDAVRVVRERGRLMQGEVPIGVGTMAAILGLESRKVIAACEECSKYGIVETANFNCTGQVVISGEINAVEKCVELCKEKGARRAAILAVSAPFHCSMLTKAGEKLSAVLDDISFNEMNIPLISNVTADYVKSTDEAKELLIRQVSSSVLWKQSIKKMISDGINTFVEIGPGKALTGFIRKTNGDVDTFNVDNLESLSNTLNELK